MTTQSFANISEQNWQPTTAYQTIQSMIQEEVNQGLWVNQDRINGWCFVLASPIQGVDSSWMTYTYQLLSDTTQTVTVIWPTGWPAPAENVNGDLPHHFFGGRTQSGSSVSQNAIGTSVNAAVYQTNASPSTRPTYKAAGECV